MIWRAFELEMPDPRLAAHTEAAHERSNRLIVSNSHTRMLVVPVARPVFG